jgi:indole-3-glycerol phosphate synthase
VDLKTSQRLAPLASKGATLVSESGISTRSDIEMLQTAGFSAFLVGERLMRAENPGGALKSLIDA